MGLLPKKNDPISDRSRALKAEISALEARIKKLEVQNGAGPRLRSSVYPSGAAAPPPPGEPVFEEVRQKDLTQSADPAATPEHFNELGVRKFDLWALFSGFKKQMRGRPLSNPKLVHYLAAGSIQGLRPLRYEKRVARNRFFALLAVLALFCLGLVFYWKARHS
jgi:cell division protein FtsB